MNANKNILGITINGVWRVCDYIATVKPHNVYFIVENIYNGRKIKIVRNTMQSVLDGKTEICKVIAKRISKGRFY